MNKIYPIFVNYNSGKRLYRGAKAVLRSPVVVGLVIIDNASSDGSLINLESFKAKKKILIVKNKRNLGFYKALNIGVKMAFDDGADAVMPLDFDLEFDFDFIKKLSKVDADMVAPALKSKMDGKWFFDYGGRINWRTGSSYHILRSSPNKALGTVSARVSINDANWFDFISGGCTIIKRRVVEKLGPFDEDYFVYWGDADYALRARENGFNVVMDGSTIVHHKLEISRQTKNFKKLRISFFDNITFIRKRIEWYYKPLAYANILFFSLKILIKAFL